MLDFAEGESISFQRNTSLHKHLLHLQIRGQHCGQMFEFCAEVMSVHPADLQHVSKSLHQQMSVISGLLFAFFLSSQNALKLLSLTCDGASGEDVKLKHLEFYRVAAGSG